MREEKKQLVADISTLLQAAPSFFLVTYKGLTAEGFGDLRADLAKSGVECHVVPNRLLKRAASDCDLACLAEARLTGDTAFVSGGEEPAGVARVLRDFAKSHPAVTFKLGVLAGKPCTAAEAESLASLPSRPVLQAQVLGLLQAPPTRLVGVLSAKVASIVYVLSAHLSSKERAA